MTDKKITLNTQMADGTPLSIELDPNDMDKDGELTTFLSMLMKAFPDGELIDARNLSLEEKYWSGLIVFDDVPRLVADLSQEDLSNQYHMESSEPQCVHFSMETICLT